MPCINFKDSARPAELPRWLSWYSICLERRRSRVRVPPEAALLFLWKKKELSLGVVACICLVSITDYSCMYLQVYEQLDDYVDEEGPVPPLLLTGCPGLGKSTVLAKW